MIEKLECLERTPEGMWQLDSRFKTLRMHNSCESPNKWLSAQRCEKMCKTVA